MSSVHQQEEVIKDELHPSHVTRISDASSFDEICINCGATDNPLGVRGSGKWGELAKPCPKASETK